MKLNRRYSRNIRSNLPFYISAAVLTAVGLLLFFLFYIAGTGINRYGDDFFAAQKREDASFTTYIEIPDEEIETLEEEYRLTLEKERCVNSEEEGYTARVFRSTKEIDLYEIIEGRVSEMITDRTYEVQMENLLASMGGLIYSMIGIGMIVCIAALYATVNMMLSESRNTISMLKVLGYDNRRIDRMTVLSSHLLLIPGIAAGTLSAWALMVWYAKTFVEVERIMIPATLTGKSILLTAFFTAAAYFVSLLFVRRRIDRTDMVECLKDNRE